MTTVFLVRHGRSSANTAGVLAGWSPGVHLDEMGIAQAQRAGERLSGIRLSVIVSSPLERTISTAEAILDEQSGRADIALDERVGECRYGDWTGRKLSVLSRRPLWKTVQQRPSQVTFPGEEGESLLHMQARGVGAIADWNTRLGARARYAVVSHGDVIKSILADALGMPFDSFQRISVDPGSISVVDYSPQRATVLMMNSTDADLSAFGARSTPARETVGGGAGPTSSTSKRSPRGGRK